ncbi:MAG TPA: hypothetical protein VFD82_12970 [Planctomycetota bacterium]|nr:hypothetical protein [Planctomycetota bacterium]
MTTPKAPVRHAGDKLTRDEFERRYSAMPHVKNEDPRMRAVLMTGVQTPEHAAFCARLA